MESDNTIKEEVGSRKLKVYSISLTDGASEIATLGYYQDSAHLVHPSEDYTQREFDKFCEGLYGEAVKRANEGLDVAKVVDIARYLIDILIEEHGFEEVGAVRHELDIMDVLGKITKVGGTI